MKYVIENEKTNVSVLNDYMNLLVVTKLIAEFKVQLHVKFEVNKNIKSYSSSFK